MSTIGRYLRNNIHNIFTYRRLMHNMTIWNDLSAFLYIIAAKKYRFENTSGYNNTHVTANQTLLLLYIVSVEMVTLLQSAADQSGIESLRY